LVEKIVSFDLLSHLPSVVGKQFKLTFDMMIDRLSREAFAFPGP
jgi:hypothetical protein